MCRRLPAQHPGRVLSAPTQLTYACCMLRQRTCVWPPLARSSWASRWLITRPTYCGCKKNVGCVYLCVARGDEHLGMRVCVAPWARLAAKRRRRRHSSDSAMLAAAAAVSGSSDQQPAPPGAHLCDELAARKGPRCKEPIACRRDVAAADVDAAADHGERRRGRHLGARRRRCGRVSGAQGACSARARPRPPLRIAARAAANGLGAVAALPGAAWQSGCARQPLRLRAGTGALSSGPTERIAEDRGFRRVLRSSRACRGDLNYDYKAGAGRGGLEAPAQRAQAPTVNACFISLQNIWRPRRRSGAAPPAYTTRQQGKAT